MMDRRHALKLLVNAAALPAVESDLFAAFRSMHGSLQAAPALKSLNAHQNATVSALAERILPRTETPGAIDARVNEFIDLILADWYEAPERARFLNGLAEVDSLCRERFAKDFVDLSSAQQSEILTLLGEHLLRDLQAVSDGPRGYRGTQPEPEENFYFTFRQLVLTGYFTSESGATQQLHYEIIPARIDLCAPPNK
jgi:gluconate 2-dehydrogenase gamma chain